MASCQRFYMVSGNQAFSVVLQKSLQKKEKKNSQDKWQYPMDIDKLLVLDDSYVFMHTDINIFKLNKLQ